MTAQTDRGTLPEPGTLLRIYQAWTRRGQRPQQCYYRDGQIVLIVAGVTWVYPLADAERLAKAGIPPSPAANSAPMIEVTHP